MCDQGKRALFLVLALLSPAKSVSSSHFDVLGYISHLGASSKNLPNNGLPDTSPCWRSAAEGINASCPVLTEVLKREVAFDLTACHIRLSGRNPPACGGGGGGAVAPQVHARNISQCTAIMSSEHFLIYTDFYTHVEATCWHYQATKWREDAASTVTNLLDLTVSTRDGLSELNSTQTEVLRLSVHAEAQLKAVDTRLTMTLATLEVTLNDTISQIEATASAFQARKAAEPLLFPMLEILRRASPNVFYSAIVVAHFCLVSVWWFFGHRNFRDSGSSLHKLRWRKIRPVVLTYAMDLAMLGLHHFALANFPSHHATALKASILDFVVLCFRQYTVVVLVWSVLQVAFTVVFASEAMASDAHSNSRGKPCECNNPQQCTTPSKINRGKETQQSTAADAAAEPSVVGITTTLINQFARFVGFYRQDASSMDVKLEESGSSDCDDICTNVSTISDTGSEGVEFQLMILLLQRKAYEYARGKGGQRV